MWHSTHNIIVIGVIIAVLSAGAVAYFLTRSISKPLRATAQRAGQISEGSLSVAKLGLKSNDEVGELGRAFDAMIDMLTTMGSQTTAIADGNMSDDVLDHTLPGDLGTAFGQMIEGVRRLVTQLKDSSEKLAGSSESLIKVSGEMGSNADRTSTEATAASSASEQVSTSVSTVAAAIEEMNTSIREVASNATEASHCVQ